MTIRHADLSCWQTALYILNHHHQNIHIAIIDTLFRLIRLTPKGIYNEYIYIIPMALENIYLY
ncbi:MAG: hypothetical protein CMJ19_24165 [Phycisphaeraceae bacterium]|nr:hypothetical protein [Phycisphaeraceae bacterium]